MDQGSIRASRSAIDHQSHPLFLDLPLAALRQIALKLDIEDRRNLALTCKPLCSIVRQLWSTVIVNIYGGFDDPVPQGLSSFSGVRKAIWIACPVADYKPSEHSDWDSNQSHNHQGGEVAHWTSPDPDATARLTVVNELLYTAINPEGTPTPRLISLRIDTNSKCYGSDIYSLLLHSSPPSLHISLPTLADYLLTNAAAVSATMRCKATESAEMIARGMREFGSGFWKLLDPGDYTLTDMVRKIHTFAENLLANPGVVVEPPPDYEQTIQKLEEESAKLKQGELAQKWEELENVRFRMNKSVPSECLGLPYSEVAVDWFTPDGFLQELISRCSVEWCYHSGVEAFLFDPYEESLKELRFTVNQCSEAEGTTDVFHRVISHQLNTLESLQQLYLGRPDVALECMPFDPRALQLPSLTRLVLNDFISVESFEYFTHFTALESLSITMPEDGWSAHPQDLTALKALPNLNSLTVDFWQVQGQQDIACLTKLTELSLANLTGKAYLVKPAVPMPNLIGVTLTKAPEHQDMRYKEDSKFSRWGLRNAATLFPNVEVLQLGSLGSAPLEINTKAELLFCAAQVDEQARLCVLSKARNLKYFQLDCVLNIINTGLDKQCETGSVALESTLDVAVLKEKEEEKNGGAFRNNIGAGTSATSSKIASLPDNGSIIEDVEMLSVEESSARAMGSLAVDHSEGKKVQRWERSVEFVSSDYDILVAEFHYCLVVHEGSSDVED